MSRFSSLAAVALMFAGLLIAVAGGESPAAASKVAKAVRPSTQPARTVVQRAACSSLCQVRQPLEKAAKVVADMGYTYIDLSCLNWPPSPPHANVAELLKDFDKEASRIESVLAANKLKVSNLTFDGLNAKDFDGYTQRFEAVMKLAKRLHAPLVNLMAPPADADRADAVAKLKVLQASATRHKVVLTLETHCKQLTELPVDAAWLCNQVPGLGLTLDPSHYYAGPNQGKDYSAIYPFVRGTGFRAGGMEWKTIQSPWGTGPIDFTAIVRRLEQHGYQGYYVAEYIEGFNELDPVDQSRKFLQWIKDLH